MSTMISSKEARQSLQVNHSKFIEHMLLLCGVIAAAWYVVINVIVPLQYAGYNFSSQAVSELSAVDAPTRSLWIALCIPYNLLVIAFGIGVWLHAGDHRSLKMAGLMMAISAAVGIFWPPMHTREVLAAGGGNISDTLHIVFTVVWLVFAILTMAFGATALRGWFRVYTIITFFIFMIFGTLTFLGSDGMSTNTPTPMIGVWERINIAAFMLWMVLFALQLLQRNRSTAS
jgi:hypothetical membrane protein